MSDARKAIDADVAAFLARGGEISRPDPRRLQAVARKDTTGDSGSSSRRP